MNHSSAQLQKADARAIGQFPWVHQFADVQKVGRDIVQVMQAANLDYSFHKEQLQRPSGEPVNNFAVIRDDTNEILSHSVGPDWTGLPNTKRFDWFSRYLDNKDATIIAAGEIRDTMRTKVCVIARLDHNTNLEIQKNDEIAKYLLLSDSYGGSALKPSLLIGRLICGNGMIGMSFKELRTIRHSENIVKKLEKTHDDISLWNLGFDKNVTLYKELAAKDLKTEANLTNYFMSVMEYKIKEGENELPTRQKNTLEKLKALFVDPVHNKGNNLWTALNAVTAYVNHEQGRSQNNALNSLFFGQGATRQSRALDLAIDYMGKI